MRTFMGLHSGANVYKNGAKLMNEEPTPANFRYEERIQIIEFGEEDTFEYTALWDRTTNSWVSDTLWKTIEEPASPEIN